jgi:hypothetical protein
MNEHTAGVMKHLCHLIPFLEDNIVFIDSDWGNEQIRHWSYPHFIYESTSEFHWREGLVPTRISRNLYLTGIENFQRLVLDQPDEAILTFIRDIRRQLKSQSQRTG